jgi:hypothetical protein
MAFGLSAAILSPVIPPLLSHWGYETINLVLGCIALSVGLAASALIRFPEVDMASPTPDMAIEPASRSVVEALKTREFWCLWLTWALAGAAGASMLVLATEFGLANFGAIFGLIFTAYGLFSGPLGPWLSGYILDLTQGNYTLVFSYLGLMYLASAGLILRVRPWQECRYKCIE